MAFFLSGFFSHLYTSTILFFTLLLLDLAIPIQSAIEILCTATSTAQRRRQLSSGQFLDLVEENVPRTLYTKGLFPNDSLESCSVCLSNFEEGDEMRKLNCEHKFHKECLDTWLKQGNQGAAATCPLCRRMVLPEDIFCSHDHDENNDGSDEDFLVYYLLSANRMM